MLQHAVQSQCRRLLPPVVSHCQCRMIRGLNLVLHCIVTALQRNCSPALCVLSRAQSTVNAPTVAFAVELCCVALHRMLFFSCAIELHRDAYSSISCVLHRGCFVCGLVACMPPAVQPHSAAGVLRTIARRGVDAQSHARAPLTHGRAGCTRGWQVCVGLCDGVLMSILLRLSHRH